MQPSADPARLASFEWQVTRRMAATDSAEGELSTAQGRALLSEAAALGAGRVLLSGGDPALRGDLADLVAHGASAGVAVHVAAPPVPRALAASLPALGAAGLHGLAAWLHAPDGKAHDAVAAAPGGFAATVDLLQTAREAGFALEVRTALVPDRLRALPAMAQLVAAIGAARWTVVAPIGPGGAAGPGEGAPIGPRALERALVTLADLAATHRFELVTVAAPHLARVVRMRHGGSPQGPAGRVHVERDGAARLFVAASGEVLPSTDLPIPVAQIDNSYSTSGAGDGAGLAAPSVLAAALRHPLLQQLGSGERLSGKCGVCSFRKLCGGSRARAFAARADLWAEDPSCAYVPRGG